jgi:flagellar hook-length control protein FliK
LAGKGEPGLTVTSQPAPLDVTLATTAATVAQAQIGALAAAGKAESGTLPAPRLDPAGIAEEKYQKSSTTNGVVATNREASEMLLAVEMSKQFSRSPGAAKAVVKAGIDDAVQAQTAIVLKDVHDVSRKPSIVDIFQIGFASPEVVVAAVAAGVEKSPAERLSERRQIPDGPGGAWGSDLIGTGNRLDTVDAGNTSSFSAEMSVAEQVTYWVTHDVQTAELKLDGMGHEPVEVSISLRGNEAHVAFRTDQLETRQVLEGAVAQLKELLRGEGLVLSGVSVGSSGQNGSNPQDRRDRQGSRQTSVNAPELMTADASQRLPRHSGRAIDLFV